jgi:hypothetical protein
MVKASPHLVAGHVKRMGTAHGVPFQLFVQGSPPLPLPKVGASFPHGHSRPFFRVPFIVTRFAPAERKKASGVPMPFGRTCLRVFREPDAPHLMNKERVFFILHVRIDHFLFAMLADKLLTDGDSVRPFLFTDDTSLSDSFHCANACPFPQSTNHYTPL